jgi:hypothetical protein
MDRQREREEREQRGILIAANAKLEKAGDGRWFVPSQSRKTGIAELVITPSTLIRLNPTVRVPIISFGRIGVSIFSQLNTRLSMKQRTVRR